MAGEQRPRALRATAAQSRKYPRSLGIFASRVDRFDPHPFRLLLVRGGRAQLRVHGLLQLSHKGLQGLIASIQDVTQFSTNGHSALKRIPSLGQKWNVFEELCSVFRELVHRFSVHGHGFWHALCTHVNLLLPHSLPSLASSFPRQKIRIMNLLVRKGQTDSSLSSHILWVIIEACRRSPQSCAI